VASALADRRYSHPKLALPRRLRRAELRVDTVELARYLVGKTLVHSVDEGTLSGRIVETEAYVVGDAAAHAFRGLTPRNRSLFLERGHAYVYFVYGCWFMLNVSSEREGVGAGVLLRALEPLDGVGLMQRDGASTKLRDLARGPGRLASAMRITRQHNGLDLCGNGPLWLGTAVRPVAAIGESVRIGLTREVDRMLRFYECGSPFVSGPRHLNRA
jgi:DNA-3-methyladenine glycosylase